MNALSPVSTAPGIARLRGFVTRFAALVETAPGETAIVAQGAVLLAALVARDDWLPPAFAEPDPTRYRQYLLHCDGRERFSVVSFVWGPGQSTPVHDHRTWGLVSVLRGAEVVEPLRRDAGGIAPAGDPVRLEPGDVDVFGPRVGDLHRVRNAFDDRVSISIHVYGGNIGAIRRATYDAAGAETPFVSGYASDVLPNLWNGIAA